MSEHYMGAAEGWVVTQDGETVAGPFDSSNDAFTWLQRHQGQSWDYAIRYGGYDIVHVKGGEVQYSERRTLEKARHKRTPEELAEEFENAVQQAFITVYGRPTDDRTVEQSIRSSYLPAARKQGWTEPDPNVVVVGTEYAWVRDMFDSQDEMARWEQVSDILRKRGWAGAWFDSINAAVHVVYWTPEKVQAETGGAELGAVELIELGDGDSIEEEIYAQVGEDYLGAKTKKRISLAEAKKIARKVAKELRPFADELILAGSVRRKRPEIGDIEFVMLPKDWDWENPGVFEELAKDLEELGYDVGPSIRKATKTVDGVKIEIYLAHHERERGGLVFMYTGDQQFNIAMRNKAKGMGYLLNQYGIWTRDKKRALLQSPNEEDFFDFLKVPYHTPEERSLRHRTKEERKKFAKKKKKSGGRMGMLSDNEDAFFSRLESVWSNDDGNDGQ